MSGSSRRVGAALAGLAALLVTLGTGAFFGALYAPHYGYYAEHPAYRAAQSKEHDPSQIDRDRAGLPYFAERIASGPDPQNTDEREKRDLAAQESVSVWTFWMLVVSGGGVLITAIGTGFLLWQIILTRRAVEDTSEATEAMREANKIARDAQRPWLSLECQLASGIHWVDNVPTIHVQTTVTNMGSTPALFVQGMGWGGAQWSIKDSEEFFRDRCESLIEAGKHRHFSAPLYPEKPLTTIVQVQIPREQIEQYREKRSINNPQLVGDPFFRAQVFIGYTYEPVAGDIKTTAYLLELYVLNSKGGVTLVEDNGAAVPQSELALHHAIGDFTKID